MEPFFLGYLLLPLGYTTALAVVSAKAERALERGDAEKAVRLLKMARKAPFLKTYRSMCDTNLITAAYALEDFELVEETWRGLGPRLESLRPYAGSALASYGATLIGRGHYKLAIDVLSDPIQQPKSNQRVDDIAVLCQAFCRANLSSAYINLGRIEEARGLLDSVEEEAKLHPVLASLRCFLIGTALYLEGLQDEAYSLLNRVDLKGLPPMYSSELSYHYGAGLSRCGDYIGAERIINSVTLDISGHRKLTRLRAMALAELASARGELDKALSYYRDLLAFRHVDALAYLRAANLSKQLGNRQAEEEFLSGAVELDPESNWAAVCAKRLVKLS